MTIEIETLKLLLELEKRRILFDKIIDKLRIYSTLKYINLVLFETSEGSIPVITISKHLDINEVTYVKVFVGAQHNEYNGLFGILNFLTLIKEQKIKIEEILLKNQVLIFFPLMNPYGFLNPSKDNKSGYYLKNGTNLNRYWRRTFAPEYQKFNDDHNEYPIPEHANIVKRILQPYWEQEHIKIYILDFHETSLLRRGLIDLSLNLQKESITYKFDYVYKEFIILNILKMYNIPYYRKPLFKKCGRNANHTHIQLSIKQIDMVYEKLLEYIVQNNDKLSFYFCYSEKSKKYCQKLANIVYNKLKKRNILWETYYPSIDHQHIYHGCIVLMNDATTRRNLYSMEIESHKQFFNLFEEIEKSKMDPNYFNDKLRSIDMSIELVVESIKEMIKLF
ncbi:MAG: hypothetical protein EU532_00090 [Promethearchaeota archaeon]|nr:MAG: hypothetical protein EU532_00090 [Candidatus Lokiarchaeota archaeon]